jgi:hypothetical protein
LHTHIALGVIAMGINTHSVGEYVTAPGIYILYRDEPFN